MSPYLRVGVMLVAVVVQVTLLPTLTFFGAHLDLVLLIALSWSLLRGAREGMLWGFVGGLALDLYSAGPLGVQTIALLLVCFLSGMGESAIFRQNLTLPMIVAFFTTFVFYSVASLLLRLFGWPLAWRSDLFRVILPAMVLNTLAMPIIYQTIRHLTRGSGPRTLYE